MDLLPWEALMKKKKKTNKLFNRLNKRLKFYVLCSFLTASCFLENNVC